MENDFFQDPQHDRELPVDAPEKDFLQPAGSSLGFYLKWATVFFLLIVSVLLGMILTKSTSQLPDIKILETYRPNESTQIFDRNGNLIANIHGDEDRVVVPLKQISPSIQQAVMAIEDNRFYEHNGVDLKGTLRALMANLNADESVQGGSTITQQLVKNLFLTPEKSYTRKIAEAILALRVEKHYSKDKILEMYLNQVYFGNLSYGIEKAARRYFKKPAKRLNLAESALLAGLLKAPEGLSPYNYPQAARRRQLEVLHKMIEYGYITEKQREEAEQYHITLNSRESKPSKHPYFVTYVIQELEKRYGEEVVRKGGLRVYTTMDEKAQDAAEKVMYEAITKSSKGSGIQQGALVAMDVETGEIVAMVGGINFQKNQFNAATMARRAVGSTFKPFVYLTGFRLGKITPKSPISDRPVAYGNWAPHNWDGRYMGAMDIRKALTLSRNTPTVQIGMKVGVEQVIKTCQLAGIRSTIDPNSSSLLGSSGVSPLELIIGYSTFARGGIYIQPTAIKRVVDSSGRLVKIDTPAPKRVFDQDHVAALVDILIDAVEKGTGRNAILKGRVVAGKTGTTDDIRDIWFMGFTPDLAAGVWMGNPKNTPLHGVFSSNAAQAWHDFAEAYYKINPTPPQPFFVASNEYAVRAGLVHLIDAKGVAEAKKKLSIEKLTLDDEESDGLSKTSNKPAASSDSKGKATSNYGANEPVTERNPSSKVASPSAADAKPSQPSRQASPPPPLPVNPAVHETPDQKQAKYDHWKNTLNNVRNNLGE